MAKSSTPHSPVSWTAKTLPRIVLVIGPESALREEALAAIKKAAFGAGASDGWVTLHGAMKDGESEALTPATVLDEACTRSMFAADDELKVVLVRGADVMLEKNYKLFEDNLDTIPNGATLIFEAANFGKLKTTNFFKKLNTRGAVVECNALAGEYGDTTALEVEIDKHALALGVRLTHGALRALLARSSKSLGVIEEELSKLALIVKPADAAGQVVEINEHDVAEHCSRTGTASAFQFADALLDGDVRLALETLGTLFERGISDSKKPGKLITQDDAIVMIVLGALAYKLSLLQDVRAVLDSGKNESVAANELKLFGKRRDEVFRSLRKHTEYSLRRSVDALFGAYLGLRRGGGVDPRAVMEEMVFKCVGKG